MRNLATVPHTITEEILAFCRTITTHTSPLYISTKVQKGTKTGECFNNVANNLECSEGSHYGWIIWQTSTHLLQAEFHSVVELDDNSLVCITPYHRPFDKILFLPDPSFVYDNIRVPSRYFPTSDAPETQEFIHALQAISELEVTMSNPQAVAYINHPDNIAQKESLSQTIHSMEQAVERFERMVLEGVGSNSLCICGSGKKFKKCCG